MSYIFGENSHMHDQTILYLQTYFLDQKLYLEFENCLFYTSDETFFFHRNFVCEHKMSTYTLEYFF
jgi:hypothetical protein